MNSQADAPLDDLPVHTIPVGTDAQRRDIAVRVRAGEGRPIVWFGGFRSDMRATKALALDAYATVLDRLHVERWAGAAPTP